MATKDIRSRIAELRRKNEENISGVKTAEVGHTNVPASAAPAYAMATESISRRIADMREKNRSHVYQNYLRSAATAAKGQQDINTAGGSAQAQNVDVGVRRTLDQQSRAYAGRTDAMRNVENAYMAAGAGAAARDAAHQNTAHAQKRQEIWQKKARGVTLTPAEQQILNRNVYKSPEKAQQREANQQINDNLQWAQERKQKREAQISEQEFNRSPAMQAQWGSYSNYVRGVYAGYDEAVAKREQEQAKTSKEWQADSEAFQTEMDKIAGQLAVAYRNPSAENYQSIITMQREWNELNRQKKETDKHVEEKQIAEKRAAKQETQRAAQEQYAGWTEEQMQGRLDELNREINSRLARSGETADVSALEQERAALQEEKSRVYPNTLQKIGNYAEDAVDALMLAGTAQAMTGYEQTHAYAEAGANAAAAWALRDLANAHILKLPGGEKYAEKLRALADKLATDVDYTGAQQWQDDYQQIMEEATKDHSGVGKWVLEQLPSAGAMIVDQGMAGLFGVNAGTGAMNVTPLTMMGIRAGGSAALDAKNEGATDAQAVLIGLENAATEVFSEKLFGGNPLYDTDVGLVNRAVSKLTNSKNVMRVLDSKAFDFVSEGLEEVVAELLEPTFQSMVLHGTLEGATNAENIGNAFLGGVFLAALGKVAGLPSGITQAQEERHIQNYAQTLSQAGMQSENAEVRAAAEAMQEKLDYGRTPDEADFGRLINAMDAANETAGAAAAVNEAQTESTTVNTDPAEHTAAEQAVIDEYQNAVDDGLVQFVEQAMQNKGANNTRYTLKPVSERAAADIQAETGIDTTGFKTVIEQRAVEHILKGHGENGTTDQSMRDINDIGRIQYVLDNYDSLENGGKARSYTTIKENGKPGTADAVVYSKKVNGTYYVVEAVPNTKAKTTFIVSAYMNKDGVQHLVHDQNGPNVNARSVDAEAPSSSNASVAEPADAVKRTDANPAAQEQTEFRAGLEYDDYVKSAVRDGELTAENAQRIDAVAKRLGVRVRFADEVAGGMANAEISGNEVLVEKHNRNPVMFLLGHEWTHRLQEIAPEQYRQFKESIMDEIGPQAQAIMDNYARNGYEIDMESALDEAAADYAGRMIDDSDILDEFIEKHRDDRTLLQRIVDALRSLIQKLTGAERKKAETAEGKLLAALDAAADASQRRSGASERRLSVKSFEDGKRYVKADRQVIFGNDANSWSEQLEDYINGKIRRGQDVTLIGADGDELILTATSAGKLSSPYTSDGRTMSEIAFERKANAAAHIDELAQISTRGNKNVADAESRHGDMASRGWNYRTAYFMDFDGKYYRVTISVAQGADGKMIYNIGQMKEEASPKVKGSSAETGNGPRGFASSENSIRDGGENVKQKNSAATDAEQRKAAQFDVIRNSNAAEDDYHTWIRSADEIRTLAETLADPEWAEYDEYDPDYTRQMAKDAVKNGKVTVYSSYPIGNGVFVTPSRMEAESYSANGKVYSKTVNVDDVAWIDPTQGQYAPVRVADIRHSVKGAEVSREYADVLKENELLKERVDYWKGQTKQTQRATTDEKAVGKEAKSIIKRYGAELDAADIQAPLQRLYDAMANGELDGREAFEGAREIAGALVDTAVETDDELYRSYKDLRDFLRTTKLTISEEDGQNISDLAELRKRNFGRMIIGKGETNVDQVYQELAEQWPEFFDEDSVSHPADQLEQIADVLEQLYTVTEQNPYQGYIEQAKTAAANEILEDFFDLPQTKKTFADRQAEKLSEAKAHGKEQASKIREQKNAQLADLREKNRVRVNTLLEKERTRRAEQIGKLKDRYKSRDAAAKERRETRELRNKIIRHTRGLSQKLVRPTDKQHIPEILRHEVAEVLSSINMEDNYTLDPATIREGKIGKDGKTTLYGEKLRGADRNEKGVPTRRSEAFAALKEKYLQVMKEGDSLTIEPYLLVNDDEGIQGGLDAVIKMGDTPLADLSKSQLETMWNVVRAVEHSVSTYGKMLSNAKYARTSQWADALRSDTSDKKPFSDRTTRVMLDLETPYTFFSHYGDAGKAIYRMLRDAQDQQQLIVNRVTEAAQKIVDPKTVKELEKQTHTFQTEGGKTLTLTTAQAMEVYNLMQREQAMEHLTVGGVFQPEVKSAKIGRGRDAIRLTKADLNQIAGVLTPEQIKIADGLQGLTAGMLADYGNEASMKAYGYRKFTEKNYWPIRSANEGVQTTVEMGGGQDHSIKNIGMAKQTTQGANNALEISSVFDTFANHASDMTDYAAWLCAMEDANHLFNYQFKGADGKSVDSVKAVLEKYGGVGAGRYWTKLMRDIQNGINTKEFSPATKAASKLISGFKGAAVGGNIRVVIQQPTAFFRAAAVLSPMDMTNGLVNGVTKGNGWEKALKYSPIAMRKDNGGFDISAPYSMKQTLFDNRDAVRKVNDALSAPAGAADAVTWGRLWNASEWAVKRAHPDLKPGSNAFYEETARQFADVIDQTQVVDGVLQRSNIMRARSEIAKQATSFKGEPIMSVNLLMRAADELFHQTDKTKKTAATKKLGRAAGALLVTDIVNAFVQSLVDGIRDDDKDKKWWDRVMSAFTGQSGDEETAWEKGWNFVLDGNLGGNLNKLASMPYISDVFSLIQGYEVARTDTEVIGDIVQAAKTFIKSADGQGQKTWVYATKATIGATAKLFGLPLNNLTRDLWGVLRSVAIETDNIPLQYQLERFIWNIDNQQNASRFGDLLYKALVDGDTASYNQIHTDMIVRMGKSGNDLKTMLRSHVKDDYTSRKLTQDEAIKFLVKHELADDKDDAFWTVQEWDNAENPEYSKYAELGDAVLNGGTSQTGMTVDELVSFYMEHGAEKKDIQTQITGAVHDAYTEGEIDAAAVESLLKQYQAYDADEGGYKTDDEIYWTARKWEAQYHGDEDYSKYDAVYEAVEGDANLKDVIREYTAHGVKEKTIASEITKHYKPLYLAASASERKAMKAYLVDAYVALGKSRSEASRDIDKWLE